MLDTITFDGDIIRLSSTTSTDLFEFNFQYVGDYRNSSRSILRANQDCDEWSAIYVKNPDLCWSQTKFLIGLWYEDQRAKITMEKRTMKLELDCKYEVAQALIDYFEKEDDEDDSN